ncbi:hypothetical protein [Arthrobacter sp. 4R501]|uniref:hypothetical protein n=1 Tax=Arthrobacter sp. 4R501 TaxID=2058886 RepID=UPI0021588EC2|nr:hypothetical protein [Arthrobacter sp. 4R501]
MRTEMENASEGTDRHRKGTYEPSILGTVYPSYYFFSVPAFNSGLNAGVGSVSSARGGGGTTGYGSSRGSFSGSGSSSSFYVATGQGQPLPQHRPGHVAPVVAHYE